MAAMRALLLIVVMLALGACTSQPAPAATRIPAPTVPAVGELLAGPRAGPVSTVGYLYLTSDGAALVGGLSYATADPPEPLGAGLWLGELQQLPAEPPLTQAGDRRFGLALAHGTLEGPGAYGPGGAYRYRLAAPVIESLGVRELSIPLLLANTELYEGQPVRLEGQLLSGPDAALLVERLGSGGVPDDTALQVKLAGPIADQALTAGLRQAGAPGVRFGPVAVTGLWRAGRLYPLAVVAR
ncbi:MAG: hypothetical protein OHK0015_27080 [Chloroflexi bacterium OHK40]